VRCRPNREREWPSDVEDAIRPVEDGACVVELRQCGIGGSRRDEPAQRTQLPHGVRRPNGHGSAFWHAKKGFLGLVGF